MLAMRHVGLTTECAVLSIATALAATPAYGQAVVGIPTPKNVPAPEPATAPVELDAPSTTQTATKSDPADIIVTGSRVTRNGYNAPTPTTVLGAEEIQRAAPANIADYVNQLPQLSGSSTPRTGNGNTSTGTNGLNLLNLRSLGPNRTLVLLDGRRVVPSAVSGVVDVNNLPTALTQRVDVVTGGASAAYGSDAVAGVVNFILQSKFTGLKGSLLGGITSRGDDETVTGNLSFGTPFAGGRGHLLLSAEGNYTAGITGLGGRGWFSQTNLLTNPAYTPTNGQPRRIIRSGVNLSQVAQGGVIVSTSLANIQFGQGGQVLPFVVGSPVSNPFMVGGNQWFEGNLVDLDSQVKRYATFARGTYEITDAIELSLEGSYGYSNTVNRAAYQRYAGNLTINAANPFIPAEIRNLAAQRGITSFRYGYSSFDLGLPVNDATRETYRGVAALAGKLGPKWKWDAYYQFGQTDTKSLLRNTTNVARFAEATDAVRNAAGQIVCRSSLTAPTNGCVPLNIFGVGVASPEAIAYVKGVASQALKLTENVASASISGEPFSLWAGPVSLAAGGEYRTEKVSGTADPISLVNGFYTGNYKGTNGSYNVKEGFAEVVVPLAEEMPFARSLEFNGAVRYTDYSTAGNVVTWKSGLTWAPLSDIKFRAVRSRDIRAPNLGELFLAGQTQAQDVNDPFNNLVLTRMNRVTIGNLDLKPEKADTTILGVVFSPTFLRQFSASVDYYKINLKGAITTLGNQEIVDRCFRGETDICQYITRNSAGVITQLTAKPINVASLKTDGVDIEASFRQPLSDISSGMGGNLTLRVLASHIAHRTTISGGVRTEDAGNNTGSTPKWRYLTTLNYDDNTTSVVLTVRGVSAGVYDNNWVSGIDIDNNRIKGATYIDVAASRKLSFAGLKTLEVFGKVENLIDIDPPVVASPGISGQQVNPILYDVVGRSFRLGVRFSL